VNFIVIDHHLHPLAIPMSELQELARFLFAAGAGPKPSGDGVFLLYVEGTSLICKEFADNAFGNQELVTSSINTNSPAATVFSPSKRSVFYVGTSSTICAAHYDEDEEEWTEDQLPVQQKVLTEPSGQLAACLDGKLGTHVFFQDTAKRLVHLDGSFKAAILPAVSVTPGSPITAIAAKDGIHVFYASSEDNAIHQLTHDGSKWADATFAKPEDVDVKDLKKLTAVFMPSGEEGNEVDVPNVFALTGGKKMLQITSDSKVLLGIVDGEGNYVATSANERSRTLHRTGGSSRNRGGVIQLIVRGNHNQIMF